METQERRLERNNRIWLIANIALCAIALAAVASASRWTMLNTLRTAAPLALFAMAMALPHSLGYFDVSQAGVGALSGALLAFWMAGSGMPEAAAILLSMLIGAAVGALNGLLSVFVCRGHALLPLVGSFALSALGIGVAFWMTGGSQIHLLRLESEFLRMLGRSPLASVLLLALALLAAVPFAVSARRKASPAKAIAAYLLSGLLSALAALWLIVRLRLHAPNYFDDYTFDSILCLAIAGAGIAFLRKRRGNARILAFVRVLLAALILAGMTTLMNFSGLDFYIQSALQAALLLICVALNALAGAAQADTAPVQEDETEDDAAPQPGAANRGGQNMGSRSKVVAALLAFFLGGTGAHRYYLGYKKVGGIQTAGFVSAIIGYSIYISSAYDAIYRRGDAGGTMALAAIFLIFSGVTSIWAFVDFIRILTGGLVPADGAPYSEYAPARGGWNEPSAQQYDPPRFNTTPPSSSRPSAQAAQPSENRQDSQPAKADLAPATQPAYDSQPAKAEPAPAAQPAYDSQPAKAEPTSASQPVPDEADGFAALEKLASLHKQGILTDEEFQKKKNDILDRL
ncbi:MAG TPA: NINE protein [Candidatus Pullichristensenella avicola]|nr:NINE protein [Candidatus Pullichristensenella avicola]